jgi:hypothetical protein
MLDDEEEVCRLEDKDLVNKLQSILKILDDIYQRQCD